MTAAAPTPTDSPQQRETLLETSKRFPNFQDTVTAAVFVDQNEKKHYEHSVIVSGLKRDQSNDQVVFSDECSEELGITPDIISTRRLGQPQMH